MRLIDADALAKKWQDVLDAKADEKGTVGYITFELFLERLKNEPTVDAVPVVRCKDCKHCEDRKKYLRCVKRGFSAGHEVMPDDFCSYGERCE